MTKLEKLGLYVGITAGIISIIDWLSESINLISYIITTIVFLVFSLLDILHFFLNIFTFKIPIWIILVVIFSIFIIYKLKKYFIKPNENSLNNQYNSFTDNEKNIFNIIFVANEKRTKCTYNNILRSIKTQQLKISNLETQHTVESLIKKNFIYLQEEWMESPHYLLTTDKGRSLAILLIQNLEES